MQILKKINWVTLISFTGLLLSSCLKDKGYDNGTYQSVSANEGTQKAEYVSIPKGIKPQVLAIEAKNETQDVNLFEAVYDNVTPATTDITVTMVVNNTLVTALGAGYTLLPTSAYTLPSLNLVIPAGKYISSPLLMKLTTNNMPDPTAVYGIGFTISTVSKTGVQTSSNLKNVVYLFTVKNKYDAEYTVTGTMVDVASASLTGYFPMTYWLITAGAQVVEGFDPIIWNNYFIPIRSGTALSGYGGYSPVFTFDASNKITSVTNIYGQPAGNGRYAELDPTGVNSWDPATKTIKVKFFMYHPAAVALPNPRVRFDWTMTYKRPRP